MLFPMLSFGFDCGKPDFGATLQELNKDGYFVKYMEKGGVSYYNYTGPCRMQVHSEDNPAIAFAFVDDQLFARINRIHRLSTDDLKKARARFVEKVSKIMGSSDVTMKQDGDWEILQWVNEKEKTKLKAKMNTKTLELKGAYYYEPLREKLKSKNQTVDPVGEME